jgi:hypothetical protein
MFRVLLVFLFVTAYSVYKFKYQFDLGAFAGGATPVPIPNTAVKTSKADGTASRGCGRVGRCQGHFF